MQEAPAAEELELQGSELGFLAVLLGVITLAALFAAAFYRATVQPCATIKKL